MGNKRKKAIQHMEKELMPNDCGSQTEKTDAPVPKKEEAPLTDKPSLLRNLLEIKNYLVSVGEAADACESSKKKYDAVQAAVDQGPNNTHTVRNGILFGIALWIALAFVTKWILNPLFMIYGDYAYTFRHGAITLIGIYAILKYCQVRGEKDKKRVTEEYEHIVNKLLPPAKQEFDDNCKKLQSLWDLPMKERAVSLLGADYFDVDCIDFFYNVISNNRAESIKEAINLYEEALYRQKMLDMQHQNQAILIQQAATQEQILRKQNEIISNQSQSQQLQKQIVTNQRRQNKTMNKLRRQVAFGNTVSVVDLLFKD